jgi:hypothetical protein
MNAAQIFSVANTFVLPGWLLLLFAPRWQWTDRIITGIIVTGLAICYVYCIGKSFAPADIQSFSTLAGVMKLFTNETAVLAGWVHYLAFDLMLGLFEVKNAQKHSINHGLVVPCLLCTFMFGPIGLLLFFLLRMIITKKYFAANY